MSSTLLQLSRDLGIILQKQKMHCAVAESCTGGSVAAAITAIEGSSQWFDRGFVTYSNQAKEEMLGVNQHVLTHCGAVSKETAQEMAQGAILYSDAAVSVAITGIAGPDGGTKDKPVGTVWFAWAGAQQPLKVQQYLFQGDRTSIREQAVITALQGLIERCSVPAQMPKSNDRYFFALYPTLETAQKIQKQGHYFLDNVQCKPTPREKIHMTLVYLGQVMESVLQDSIQVANQLKGKEFQLIINEDGLWPHNKVRWLSIKDSPKELLNLVNELKKALTSIGFKPERRPFTPHITMARDCRQMQGNIQEPIVWQVKDFCLVKSTSANPSQYEIIQRWALS
jgi:nicotinamide-nucleotide amidase